MTTKISITWAELLLVVLLAVSGMGIWIAAEWLVEKGFDLPTPQEEDFQIRHHVPDRQRRLAMVEDDWKATHAFLVAQGLEVKRQLARLKALEKVYPGLEDPSPAAGSIPEEAVKAYLDSRVQMEAAALLEIHLQDRLGGLKILQATRVAALSEARHAAADDWKEATASRARKCLSTTALLAALGATVLLIMTGLALGRPTSHRLGFRLRPLLGAAAVLLVILYAYQALGALSAAVGSLLLLVLTGSLFRTLSFSDSTGADP